MRYLTASISIIALTTLSACSDGGAPAEDTPAVENDATSPTEAVIGTATLQLADGTSAGTSVIQDTGTGITIEADVQNIEPGPHGFHLHQTGSCDAPDFTSAGGHLNPTDKGHGTLSPDGAHVGDLPNIDIGTDGTGTLSGLIEGTAAQVTEWLFDDDGTAVMVHAGPDDYKTDPSGDAGARVACGVLTRP
ncbi:MAG: superoxide dismutase family protein [Pontixanthobacter sp.]